MTFEETHRVKFGLKVDNSWSKSAFVGGFGPRSKRGAVAAIDLCFSPVETGWMEGTTLKSGASEHQSQAEAPSETQ